MCDSSIRRAIEDLEYAKGEYIGPLVLTHTTAERTTRFPDNRVHVSYQHTFRATDKFTGKDKYYVANYTIHNMNTGEFICSSYDVARDAFFAQSEEEQKKLKFRGITPPPPSRPRTPSSELESKQ